MKTLHQSPTATGIFQNPYPFYAAARAQGPLHFWADYNMPAAFSHAAVHTLLRDRRFGREIPAELAQPGPAHLAPFLAVEAHSLLDAEPPRHTRLRGLILRAFTSRRIAALGPQIETLCHQLIDAFPTGSFDLLQAYCTQIPVIIIARLLGVPEAMAPQLTGLVAQDGRDVSGQPYPRDRRRRRAPPVSFPPFCAVISTAAAPRPMMT